MKVIVNDANILIDLVELDILSSFFRLKFEFLTTSLILEELFPDQQAALQPYIDRKTLEVQDMSADDLVEISKIQQQKSSLSEQDCSAFYQAKKNSATLITSDNTLRKYAKQKQMEVHGHLWVFERMVQAKTISGTRACEKLEELCEKVNPKLGLPESECKKRIKKCSKI